MMPNRIRHALTVVILMTAAPSFAQGTVTIVPNPRTFQSVAIGVSTGPRILSGSGSPEGASTAPVGSVYLRTDGGASTTVYFKESGTGNTGWTAAGAGVSLSAANTWTAKQIVDIGSTGGCANRAIEIGESLGFARNGTTRIEACDGTDRITLFSYGESVFYTGWVKMAGANLIFQNDDMPSSAKNNVHAYAGGTWYSSATGSGNVGAGEDNLFTALTVGAAFVNANQQALTLEAAGTTAASANNKRIRAHTVEGVNDTTICDTGAMVTTAAGSWTLKATARRTSTTAVAYSCEIVYSDGTLIRTYPKVGTGTYTWANAGTMTVTGEATDNNDVVGVMVESGWKP